MDIKAKNMRTQTTEYWQQMYEDYLKKGNIDLVLKDRAVEGLAKNTTPFI